MTERPESNLNIALNPMSRTLYVMYTKYETHRNVTTKVVMISLDHPTRTLTYSINNGDTKPDLSVQTLKGV